MLSPPAVSILCPGRCSAPSPLPIPWQEHQLLLAWYLTGICPAKDPREALCSRASFSLKHGVCPQSPWASTLSLWPLSYPPRAAYSFLSASVICGQIVPDDNRTLGRCFPHFQISQFSFWLCVTDSCPFRKGDVSNRSGRGFCPFCCCAEAPS